jgi:CheY-like chemotaxis protein
MRALVADDDRELLDLIASTISEELGVEVTRANDGHELLSCLAHEGPFDFLVTDVAMPWMSGLQVAHAARAAGLVIPTLVMTARREPAVARQIYALGDHATLLAKPFSFEELVAALQTCAGDVAERRGAHTVALAE